MSYYFCIHTAIGQLDIISKELWQLVNVQEKNREVFHNIKEYLMRGIVAVAELREQWSKLAQFFQMTSNIIHVCLNKSVKKLAEAALSDEGSLIR